MAVATLINRQQAHMAAALWMLAGCLLIMLVLSLINTARELVKEKPQRSALSFEVKNLPPPKQKPVQQPRPKPRNTSKPPPVPAALLNSSLSGLDLGLAGFAANELGDVNKDLLGNVEGVVMTADMVDEKPRVLKQVPVEFPPRAKAKDLEGYVTLTLLISEQGKVLDVQILESDPKGYFENNAINAVKNWLFKPARYKGQPVRIWANQTIRFEFG